MSKRKNYRTILFLIGLGSMTQIQVIGSIGISELIVFIVAPFIFINDSVALKRDGFMPVLFFSFLSMLGCVCASIINNTAFQYFIRGFATCYSIFAMVVVLHRFLNGKIMDFKWVLIGACFSGIINIYMFHRSVEVYMVRGANEAVMYETIVSGPLFWLSRIDPFLRLPTDICYLSIPTWLSAFMISIMPLYTMATTATGRSASLLGLLSSFIVLLVGKRRSKMAFLQNNILLLAITALIVILTFKQAYVLASKHGILNEKAQDKYEAQIGKNEKTDALNILMQGRIDFFIGVYAALKKPIIGYGPWAIDEGGIAKEFLYKYGNQEDYMNFVKGELRMLEIVGHTGLIPGHSHIVTFWLWFGILGLPLWIYVLYLLYRHLRYNLSTAPNLFCYFLTGALALFWDILFSPYSNRTLTPLFIVMLLMVDAMRRGAVEYQDLH